MAGTVLVHVDERTVRTVLDLSFGTRPSARYLGALRRLYCPLVVVQMAGS